MFTTADLFGKFHSPKAPLLNARNQIAAASPNELEKLFGPYFPAGLFSQAEEGPNSLQRALQASAQAAEQRAPSQWRFHGKEVLVGDGTINSAPDTPKNQRAYPQSARQKTGCGFPLLRWVALFSMTSGALLEVALGNKHTAELKLFRRLWHRLQEGMIFLADRGFCDFVTIAGLWLRKVDCVLRLNAMRPHDFRKGK